MPHLLSSALPAFGFIAAALQRPRRALQALWGGLADPSPADVRRHLARYY